MADALEIIAIVAIVAGVFWIYPPAGLIVGGLLGLAAAYLIELARDRATDRGPSVG